MASTFEITMAPGEPHVPGTGRLTFSAGDLAGLTGTLVLEVDAEGVHHVHIEP